MFEIDYRPDTDQIIINGVSATRLLKGRAGTILSIILGFYGETDDLLVASCDNNPGLKIAETSKALDNFKISNSLSEVARQALEQHINYLRQFRQSSIRGRDINEIRPTSITLPTSFHRKLKPFQIPSVCHIKDVTNSANFSVPGSGKTTMVLAAYSILKELKEVSKIFVICPRSAFEPWTEEYRGCFETEPASLRISGPQYERAKLLSNTDYYELFLCTYQMLPNEINSIIKILKKYPCLLVLDESHHIKRGEGGVWYDSVLQIAPLAKRRIILTGTPAPNLLEDLVPQFEALWPDLNPAKKAMDLYGDNEKIEDFRDALCPYYTRVRKDELGLPKRQMNIMHVRYGIVQQKIYDVLCQRILTQSFLKPEERSLIRDLRKAIVVRLIQAASNPSLLGEFSYEYRIPPLSSTGIDLDELIHNYSSYEKPQKLVVASNLAKQLSDKGRKSIIWTSFVHNAELLHKLVLEHGIKSVCVTGNIAKDENMENDRDFLLHQFKTDPKMRVLVATIPAIAESVSLHRECHDAIYVDRTFNCGLYMQSLDRIHRVGLPQNADIRYHLLLGINSIDDVIENRLKFKMDVMHRVLNDDIGILNLDVPEDLSEGDWDDEDISAILEHLRQQRSR